MVTPDNAKVLLLVPPGALRDELTASCTSDGYRVEHIETPSDVLDRLWEFGQDVSAVIAHLPVDQQSSEMLAMAKVLATDWPLVRCIMTDATLPPGLGQQISIIPALHSPTEIVRAVQVALHAA